MIPRPELQVGGRLSHFLPEWEEVTSDSWVLGVVARGLSIPFRQQPPLASRPIFEHPPADPEKRLALQQEVLAMLEKGAIQELPNADRSPGFYSRIFFVRKKFGKWRLVIDLSILNTWIVSPHFKMVTPRTVLSTVQPWHWAASIDLKDAYFHIPILKRDRKFLRFTFDGKVYQFRVLPFGITTAPLVFTKVLQVVGSYLHKRGIDILIYFDDSLVLSYSRDQCAEDTRAALATLIRLGFIPSGEKSELTPSQDFIFLGYRFRTDLGLVLPPEEKFCKALELVSQFLRSNQVTARWYLRLLGYLNCIADVIPLGRLHIRPLQAHLLRAWSPASKNWETPVTLDSTVKQSAMWWTLEANVLQGTPLKSPSPERTLYTDASLSGWGGFLDGRIASGLWSRKESPLHINILEMRAVFQSLTAFLPLVQNTSLCLATDNSTVVAYLRNQGGTKSLDLCCLTRDILMLCHDNGISLLVKHVPGKLNILADTLSRARKPVITEWTLAKPVFHSICRLWDRPHVDLFATALNHQLPTYVSPVPDGEAFAVDALSIPWEGMFAYAFPPFNLVGRVVQKAKIHSCLLILIAPLWSGQPWFPDLLSLLVDFPRELPMREDLLVQPVSRVPHPKPAMLHLHAWKLSSQDSLRRDFLRKLPNASLDRFGLPLLPSTTADGAFSVIGASAGKLIHSQPLYKS